MAHTGKKEDLSLCFCVCVCPIHVHQASFLAELAGPVIEKEGKSVGWEGEEAMKKSNGEARAEQHIWPWVWLPDKRGLRMVVFNLCDEKLCLMHGKFIP